MLEKMQTCSSCRCAHAYGSCPRCVVMLYMWHGLKPLNEEFAYFTQRVSRATSERQPQLDSQQTESCKTPGPWKSVRHAVPFQKGFSSTAALQRKSSCCNDRRDACCSYWRVGQASRVLRPGCWALSPHSPILSASAAEKCWNLAGHMGVFLKPRTCFLLVLEPKGSQGAHHFWGPRKKRRHHACVVFDVGPPEGQREASGSC